MSMGINHDTINSSGNHNLSHEEFWVYGFAWKNKSGHPKQKS